MSNKAKCIIAVVLMIWTMIAFATGVYIGRLITKEMDWHVIEVDIIEW